MQQTSHKKKLRITCILDNSESKQNDTDKTNRKYFIFLPRIIHTETSTDLLLYHKTNKKIPITYDPSHLQRWAKPLAIKRKTIDSFEFDAESKR